MTRRRAVALCRPSTLARDIQYLVDHHWLELVYTVITDCSAPKLAVMIAAQHLFEHGAEVLVVPYMTCAGVAVDERWSALTVVADIVTCDGIVDHAPLSRSGCDGANSVAGKGIRRSFDFPGG